MKNLDKRTVMVTGAGGSIGTELVKAIIITSAPSHLVLIDLCEHNLYQVQRAVLDTKIDINVTYLLADIRHRYMIECVFDEYRPDVVFHAAALKHVPMLETPHNTLEAIRTNVLGTKNLVDMAVKRASEFVLVSTDKAVNPVSMMGSTKTFAEGYVREAAKGKIGFRASIVRFGNVLGSSGSVVPLFKKQIEAGGPVTVTDPEIVRYFMSIEEAVHLVLRAAMLSSTESNYEAHTYILDMGEPVKIDDLARDMIQKSGKDIHIEYIGLREGEKLYEELRYEWETLTSTRFLGVFRVAQGESPYTGYSHIANELVVLCDMRDLPTAFERLKTVVPYKGRVIRCESL